MKAEEIAEIVCEWRGIKPSEAMLKALRFAVPREFHAYDAKAAAMIERILKAHGVPDRRGEPANDKAGGAVVRLTPQ